MPQHCIHRVPCRRCDIHAMRVNRAHLTRVGVARWSPPSRRRDRAPPPPAATRRYHAPAPTLNAFCAPLSHGAKGTSVKTLLLDLANLLGV